MLSRAELIKYELLEQISRLCKDRLSTELSEKVSGFVGGLYEGVPPNDIIRERPENLYGAAISFFRFGEKRDRTGPKVRVFNPEIDRHGWQSTHTIVEVVNDDMPFLVDSVTASLNRSGAETRLVIHPIFRVERDSLGKLERIEPSNGERQERLESWMHLKIRAQPESEHRAIQQRLEGVLADVRLAVEDFDAMRERCTEVISDIEGRRPPETEDADEIIAFLEWLNNHHFTYIGYRACTFGESSDELQVDPGGLGILRDENRTVFEGFRRPGGDELLRILKANQRSTVHRPVHLDAVIVSRFDEHGSCVGEHLFVGLFTLEAYSMSPRNIPLLQQKIDRLFERAGFARSTHDGKSLQYILETFPRDELFQTSDDELLAIAIGILQLQWRRRVALFVRHDPFDRFISCLIYVPRDRFDTELRLRIQDILQDSYHGAVTAYYTHLTDEPLARLHLIVKTPQGLPDVEHASVERKLLEATRSWEDRLEEALISDHGEEFGSAIARKYADAFPAGYREDFDEITAVNDIDFIEEAQKTGKLALNLYRPVESGGHELNFKIFSASRYVTLSEVMPMLENMGLKVSGEVPYEIRLRDTDQRVWVHDFSMITEDCVEVELGKIKTEFHKAFTLIWDGDMDNDGFNKLVVHAGASPRSIKVLRAYSKYLRQIQVPFSQAYMERTLRRNGEIARQIAELFAARFDPNRASERRERELQSELVESLEQVKSLDEDRILRLFLGVITATLRTNFYQCDSEGRHKSYISLKLAPRELEEVPRPRPYREIFVFSPRVEGVHLRFGAVARGGLRWSDRPEDYRTEVLGLAKAQQVKNSVIVPVGSKGGFVVKRPPAPETGRSAHIDEGVECYKIFISGLLDVTDNFVQGEVLPPQSVVRHDDDDPYLVVAADKGTATFSDIANEVSRRYGFWLDDAFASGGSAGYDHKEMGITARGAWESVKRHFREMGKDIQKDDFTCVGVGDMSGDVFGNGMLLSKHIKLIAAFNHLHIFIDPDPDPAKSWQERKRLFDQSRSTWKDYDPELISKGGGVFERSAKSIPVSVEMKEKFGLSSDKVTPNELIVALLMANVELLWFGGIGTYIKSSEETHSQVGDRANDAIRVNGNQVAARVIGEGANLGATQQGRIEYSMQGGRCYTDFIDNSAGVDCSDHEVNIKILLGDVESAGDLTRKQRDDLLEKMTDEVAELVLRDNYLQSQTISVTHRLGTRFMDRIFRFMKALERNGQLDRAIEFLPDDEMVVEREKQGIAFTRPELAVLLSYAKNTLYGELLDSDIPDDTYLTHDLTRYFPEPIAVDYTERALEHRLRREIVVTVVTNEIINRLGLTFVYETKERTGMPAAEVARAYTAAREILQMRTLWEQIEALDNNVVAATQYAMHAECGRLLDRFTVWLLRQHGISMDIQQRVTAYQAGVRELMDNLSEMLSDADRALVEERVRSYVADGVPEELAARAGQLPMLAPAGDIVRIAEATERPVRDVGAAYFSVGARFGFQWLRRAAAQLPTDRAWDKQAVSAIVDDLLGSQAELTSRVLTNGDGQTDVTQAIEQWAEERRPLLARNEQLFGELETMPAPDFAMLAVANRQLKGLLAGK